jgi:hypothetical protein
MDSIEKVVTLFLFTGCCLVTVVVLLRSRCLATALRATMTGHVYQIHQQLRNVRNGQSELVQIDQLVELLKERTGSTSIS